MSDMPPEMNTDISNSDEKTKQANTDLLLEISRLCHRKVRKNVENILLLGMSGAGKSALVNTVIKVLAGTYIPKAGVGRGGAGQSRTLTLTRFENCGVAWEDVVEGLQTDIVRKLIEKKLLPTIIDVAGKGNVNNQQMTELLELLLGGYVQPGTSIESLEKLQEEHGVGSLLGDVFKNSNPKWKVNKVVFVQGCHDAVPTNLIGCLQSVLRITDSKTGVPKYTQDVYVVITKYDLVSELPEFECGEEGHTITMEQFEQKEKEIAEEFNIEGALKFNRTRWVSYVDSVGHDNPHIDNIALNFLKRMVTPGIEAPTSHTAVISTDVWLKLKIKKFIRETHISWSFILIAILVLVLAYMMYQNLAKPV